MAQSGYTPIQLYYSTTAAAVPVNTNLSSGELAINITDGKLYYKNNSGVVTLLASAASESGGVIGPSSATDNALARFDTTTGKLIQNSVGILSDTGALSGLTDISASGNVTLSGGTANGVAYLNGSKVVTSGSALTYNGTTLKIGSTNPVLTVSVDSGVADTYTYFNNTNFYNYIYFQNSGTTFGSLLAAYGTGMFYNFDTQVWRNNAGSEQMRLTSTGLGIGTSSPNARLSVYAGAMTNQIVVGLNTTDTLYGSISFNGDNSSGRLGLTGGGGSDKNLYVDVPSGGAHYFRNASSLKMQLDSSGNLGLGITPSAWFTSNNLKAFQLGGGSLVSYLNNQVWLASNYYLNSSGADTYVGTGAANRLIMDGAYKFFTAPSGTAGNAITFTQAMTLDASGNLGIGTSSPSYKLDVVGNSAIARLQSTGASQNAQLNFQTTVATWSVGQNITLSNGSLEFYNGSLRATLDSSGNLGLGVTPSAWSALKSIDIASTGSLFATTAQAGIANNAYFNGTNWIYKTSTNATFFRATGSAFEWQQAPSGTAGNAITFTQAMTLDASGNLALGTTSANGKMTIIGNTFDIRSTGGGYGTGYAIEISTNANVPRYNLIDNGAYTGVFKSTSGVVALSNQSNNALTFETNATERARIDSSGNLGLGVTPTGSWGTQAMMFGKSGAGSPTYPFIASTDTQTLALGSNTYWNGSVWKAQFASAITAMREEIAYNEIGWSYAPAVTAGTTQSFVRAMTLDNSGNLILPLGNVLGKSDNTGAVAIYGGGVYNQGAGILVSGKSNTNPNLVIFTREGYAESARIDSSGNLLIGRTSSSGLGQLQSAGGADLATDSGSVYLARNSGGTVCIAGTSSYAKATINQASLGTTAMLAFSTPDGTYNPRAIVSYVTSSSRQYVDFSSSYSSGVGIADWVFSSGNLLVGTTNSGSGAGSGFKVLSPSAGHWDPAVVTSGNSSGLSCWDIYSTATSSYRFYATTAGVVNAVSTTINAISDRRLKENIRDLDDGLNVVMALKPRKFDWKEGKGADIKNARGFIAQEFEEVLPDLIGEWKDPAPEGEEPYKSVRADLIPTLVKAIQEQQAIIESLKARLDAANL